jgi:hypothetical protein
MRFVATWDNRLELSDGLPLGAFELRSCSTAESRLLEETPALEASEERVSPDRRSPVSVSVEMPSSDAVSVNDSGAGCRWLGCVWVWVWAVLSSGELPEIALMDMCPPDSSLPGRSR